MSRVNHLALLSGNSKPMNQPLVIAHRGASAYRPENTLAAFALGLEQGADGIEFDLVSTQDEVLTIRHENTLSETTNIATVPEFRSRKRMGLLYDSEVFDWFSEDFSHAELATLKAIERLPELRPDSAKFDGEYEIPTFAQLLEAHFIVGKVVVAELKSGSHSSRLTSSIAKLAAKELALGKAKARYIVESFDLEMLLEAKHEMQGLPVEYLFALHQKTIGELDFDFLSNNFLGLALSLEMLFAEDWVTACHSHGLEIWVYTARAEDAQTSVDEYYERIIQTGVDAIFADHPDLLRRVLSDRG